ncbi:hypothetical protein SFRURICE_019487 [Spodoptera frugiperda]|nr:hypothetical protein SFRURICE_019487 [Spodoptera frugiperda]
MAKPQKLIENKPYPMLYLQDLGCMTKLKYIKVELIRGRYYRFLGRAVTSATAEQGVSVSYPGSGKAQLGAFRLFEYFPEVERNLEL